MSDNLPDIVRDEPREVARADTDSWIDVVGQVAKFAGYIAGTEFVPKSLRDSPAAATAAIMYGREVGLPPMTSLTQTHVIEGRPSMAAEAMRALVLAAGHDIEVTESTGGICKMRARRRGSERWTPEVVWTLDMARAAGLLNKSNWKNWPRRMLQARATSELCELYFPDVILGFRSVEELEDMGGEETAPAQVVQGTTPVARKRATKKAAAALPAAPPPAERPAAPAGPPLPGEPGFDQDDTDKSGGAPDDGPAATVADAGEHLEGAPSDAPAAEPVDVSGAKVLDEELPTRPEVAAGPAEDPPAELPEDAPTPGPRMASRGQMRMLWAQLGELNIAEEDREERLLITSKIVGRSIATFNDLTNDDAKKLIDTLGRVRDRVALNDLLDAIDDQEGQS